MRKTRVKIGINETKQDDRFQTTNHNAGHETRDKGKRQCPLDEGDVSKCFRGRRDKENSRGERERKKMMKKNLFGRIFD